MKIIFDAVEPVERGVLVEVFRDHELVFLEKNIAPNEIVQDADIVSVFVSSSLTAATLSTMPSVRMVATRSTGFDHIDTASVRTRKIMVATVPSYGTRTVAEFTFALILALSRKAYAAFDELRDKGTADIKRYEGFDLVGKTIGIIGTGKIGKNTARIANGFGMHVLLSDMHPDDSFAHDIGAMYGSLEDVVAKSDIVSLHVPYMKETHHLINESVLAHFKKGSYLVNTARGL